MEINSLLDFSHHFSTVVHSLFAFNPEAETCFSIAKQIGFAPENLVVPQLIHSTGVKWVETPGKYSGIDGIITSKTNLILSLKVADCVPVYFFEPQKNITGLVHSGWRGTVNGIITKTIELMYKQGAEVQKILVYLGPAIGICCYEVDEEVAHKFDSEAKMKLRNACPPFSVDQNDQRRGKWKVGLHEQISLQLAAVGILEENIQTSDMCTYESQDCHSYRRDGENAGRMFAFMRLKH